MPTTLQLATERKLLERILHGLKTKTLSVDQAQQLARVFVALLPPKSDQHLLGKLYELGEKHDIARDTYFDLVHQFSQTL